VPPFNAQELPGCASRLRLGSVVGHARRRLPVDGGRSGLWVVGGRSSQALYRVRR
jgi:hypothetical protein